MRLPAILTLGATLALATATSAGAQSGADFYKGKDVKILIGAGVGGSYGLYAQLAARHMRNHIPGQPTIIVQNMPGAGGLVGLNYSYNVAPKDGTLMHLIHSEVLYETLLNKDVKFSAQNYLWIGRFTDADSVMLATRQSGLRTIAEAKSREVTLGTTGIANIYALAPLMLNRMAATRFKIIGGYKGAADVFIAMERGEVEGAGMTLANALAQHGDKLKAGDLVPVFAISAKRIPVYPDLPAVTEFGGGADKALLEVYASTGTIGRALAFPPGVAADRLNLMREAFEKTIKDPAFLGEAQKASATINPMSGQVLEAEVNRVMKTPADQVASARRLHEELLGSNK